MEEVRDGDGTRARLGSRRGHPSQEAAHGPGLHHLRPDAGPGDRASLRDLYDASYRRLVVQLYGVTGDLDEAEDVVQEAFVRAAAAERRFRRGGRPRGTGCAPPPSGSTAASAAQRGHAPGPGHRRSRGAEAGPVPLRLRPRRGRPGVRRRMRHRPDAVAAASWPRASSHLGGHHRRGRWPPPPAPTGHGAGLARRTTMWGDCRPGPGAPGMPLQLGPRGAPAAVSVEVPADGPLAGGPERLRHLLGHPADAGRRSTSRPGTSSGGVVADVTRCRTACIHECPHRIAAPQFVRARGRPRPPSRSRRRTCPHGARRLVRGAAPRWRGRGTTAVHVRLRVPARACRNGHLPWTFDTRRGVGPRRAPGAAPGSPGSTGGPSRPRWSGRWWRPSPSVAPARLGHRDRLPEAL